MSADAIKFRPATTTKHLHGGIPTSVRPAFEAKNFASATLNPASASNCLSPIAPTSLGYCLGHPHNQRIAAGAVHLDHGDMLLDQLIPANLLANTADTSVVIGPSVRQSSIAQQTRSVWWARTRAFRSQSETISWPNQFATGTG